MANLQPTPAALHHDMKTFALGNGRSVSVDDEDYAVASQYKWTYRKQRGCATAWHNGASVYLGRVILNIPMGDSRIVCYRNGNRLDNRKKNLFTSGKGAILSEALKKSRERKSDAASDAHHRNIMNLLSTWRLTESA